MNFVGIDLHKKTISICVVSQERGILDRKRFYCGSPGAYRGLLRIDQAVSGGRGGDG